jgi:ribosomal protection tetracycline resistance protein
LMRTLQRLHIPTLIFVNKIDRVGARYERVLQQISEKLTPAIVAMGSTHDLGTRRASFMPYGAYDTPFVDALTDLIADHDDSLLAAYVDGETHIAYTRLRDGLAAHTKRARVHPVFFGSAITGAGVDAIMAGVAALLPVATDNADGPVSGTVFKVERGAAGEKIAYVRMFSGTLHTRDRLRVGNGNERKVTAVSVFERGASVASASVSAGQIGRLWGLGDIRIGDPIGAARIAAAIDHHFAPPTLETVIVPSRAANTGALHVALSQLAEQDPLINLRHDDVRHETHVSLYGEVQKEVIQETLANDFGIAVEFRETTTICIERPIGSGVAFEIIGTPTNPFLATVGLRVDAGPVDSGVEFRLEVELGSIPLSFHTAVEDTVQATLHQGVYGWRVTDCTVTMTHSGYWARQSHAHGTFDKSMSSTAGDFRNLTPLVLMAALQRAGTVVHEPIHRFHLEVPADTLGAMFTLLARLNAVPDPPMLQGRSCTLEGRIPAVRVHELQQLLPGPSRGEGVLDSAFDSYQPVGGAFPTRSRTDQNPLDRKEYLLRTARRI